MKLEIMVSAEEDLQVWMDRYESLVRSIGSATYGKERWFYEGEDVWYDRKYGDYIHSEQLEQRVYEELDEL